MAKHIISLSGGKDSTAMVIGMIEKSYPIDDIVCVDTTKEFPEMYEHIEKVKKYIIPLTITTISINFDYWFGDHIKTKGKNEGHKGYGWPDNSTRWCTFLKRDEKIRHYKSCGLDRSNVIEFVGISSEESDRTILSSGDKFEKRYPLIEMGLTGKQALEYCYQKGFDWNGLYKKFNRVSCWCCPLSSLHELRMLYDHYPEFWKELQNMDKKSFRRFKNDYSVEDLTEKFRKEKSRQFFVFDSEGNLVPNKKR